MTEESGEFQMHLPFWIDTDAYSERDQDMFVAGYEFCQVVLVLEARGVEFRTTIHRENESRVRMAAGKLGRIVEIEQCDSADDPDGTWSYLTIKA